MAPDTSLHSIHPTQFGYLQARHLLNRAGFGGSPDQIDAIQKMGLNDAVDYIVDYERAPESNLNDLNPDPDIISPPTREQREMFRRARRGNDEPLRSRLQRQRNERRRADRQQMYRIQQWWLAQMVATPRPLQEKLTLFWHGHFATSYRTVRDSYLMLKQNEFFRRHANGSFADLAHGTIKDPAMLRFLDNNRNRRLKPNENLARELMELFTLGEGNYTESDIKNGARALTGYTFADNDFVFNQRAHDDSTKTILGKQGSLNGEDFVDILLARTECSRFITGKLYQYFVTDLPGGVTKAAESVIRRLAVLLRQKRYQLRPLLKTLFKSRHFYDPTMMDNMIKTPVQLVVGTVRMLQTPTRDLGLLTDALSMMGQALFNPPTVAGWSGGRSMINTSTLLVRHNVCTYLISGLTPFDDNWNPTRLEYDATSLINNLPSRSPEAIMDRMSTTLWGSRRLERRRTELVRYMKQHGSRDDTLGGLLLLMTTAPEYQLC